MHLRLFRSRKRYCCFCFLSLVYVASAACASAPLDRHRGARLSKFFRRLPPRWKIKQQTTPESRDHSILFRDQPSTIQSHMPQSSDLPELYDDHSRSWRRRITSKIANVLRSVMRHPDLLGKIAARCVQVGLLAYLGYTGWKIVGEIAEAVDSVDGASNMRSTAMAKNPNQVQKVVDFLMQNPSDCSVNVKSEVPLPLVQLGRKLMASGVPLLSQDKEATTVETLLLSLTKEEVSILEQCLVPPRESIWESIVGLKPVQEQLKRTVAMLRSTGGSGRERFPSLFGTESGRSHLPGVLMYGPPGCGKSLLVQGLGSMAPCLVLTPSVLLRKYVGESNAQVRRLFTLISKLAPCILCVDELDGLFRERSDREDEVTRELKTEFFQWWDGLLTGSKPVLVIGATNRPFDVDPAVLRRLPQSFFIGFPDARTRFIILQRLLNDVPTVPNFAWVDFAKRTEGYTPSDLRNLLQMSTILSTGRMLCNEDVLRAMNVVAPPRLSALYKTKLQMFMAGDQHNAVAAENEDAVASRWQTADGNFYDLGTLEIDLSTFEALTEIAKAMIEESDEDDL